MRFVSLSARLRRRRFVVVMRRSLFALRRCGRSSGFPQFNHPQLRGMRLSPDGRRNISVIQEPAERRGS